MLRLVPGAALPDQRLSLLHIGDMAIIMAATGTALSVRWPALTKSLVN